MISEKQKIQEQSYTFPYHYIPRLEEGIFYQVIRYSMGMRYVCTLEFLLDKLQGISFHTLCDFGCGDGRLVREIAELYNDKEIEGIDYSERAISLARALNPCISFHNIDVFKENLGKTFNVVTLIEVFEHIPPIMCNDFILGLNSVLKKGGDLLVTVPHQNFPVTPKHYQHFNSIKILKYFDQYYDLKEIAFIENRNIKEMILNKILVNKFLILNHKGLTNLIYSYYKKNQFLTTEDKCGRIFLHLKKK